MIATEAIFLADLHYRRVGVGLDRWMERTLGRPTRLVQLSLGRNSCGDGSGLVVEGFRQCRPPGEDSVMHTARAEDLRLLLDDFRRRSGTPAIGASIVESSGQIMYHSVGVRSPVG